MYRESKECLKQCMAHVLEEILWKDSGSKEVASRQLFSFSGRKKGERQKGNTPKTNLDFFSPLRLESSNIWVTC